MNCDVGKATEGWRMSCDVGEVTEGLENELCYDYNYELCSFSNLTVTTNFPTLPWLYLCHSSFSNPSVASPSSQFILQLFFRFSYVTSSSLNSPGEPPMTISLFPICLTAGTMTFRLSPHIHNKEDKMTNCARRHVYTLDFSVHENRTMLHSQLLGSFLITFKTYNI